MHCLRLPAQSRTSHAGKNFSGAFGSFEGAGGDILIEQGISRPHVFDACFDKRALLPSPGAPEQILSLYDGRLWRSSSEIAASVCAPSFLVLRASKNAFAQPAASSLKVEGSGEFSTRIVIIFKTFCVL